MGHYKSNVRDLEFNLFEVLQLEKVLATGEFGDLDADVGPRRCWRGRAAGRGPARRVVRRDRPPPADVRPGHARGDAARAVQEVVAGLAATASGSGSACPRRSAACPRPRWSRGRSTSSSSAHNPRRSCTSPARRWRTSSTTSATSSRSSWAAWPSSATGAPRWCSPSPTRAPTSAPGRTKAVEQPDGTWHLDGVKRFITTGDSDDLFENIVHLVLARPEGAGPGTKGLSLFFVPKFLPDPETGEPGERNGVFVTGLEHKMGLKASATCELTFGQHGTPARRLAGRRHPQRHRADVQGHRVRANDGRHQGDRDAVDRLPERARVRQDARPGRRPDADDRQDRAARDDPAPPRRAAGAADAEGLRRGAAGAVPLHRRAPGRRGGADRLGRRRRTRASASTTCCCRSSRASAPSGPTSA